MALPPLVVSTQPDAFTNWEGQWQCVLVVVHTRLGSATKQTLRRRASYGGRKGRRAQERLRFREYYERHEFRSVVRTRRTESQP